MTRLRWLLRQAVDQHGWPATIGVVLLAACAVFYAAVVFPLEQRVNSDSSTSASTRTHEQRRVTEDELRRALAKFYVHFQDRRALQEHLTAIHTAARAAGISLKRAEYRMADEASAQLKQYRIVVPVVDTYPRIRHFVSSVLAAVPVAALDAISFQRRKIGDATVEAEIQLTVYFVDQT